MKTMNLTSTGRQPFMAFKRCLTFTFNIYCITFITNWVLCSKYMSLAYIYYSLGKLNTFILFNIKFGNVKRSFLLLAFCDKLMKKDIFSWYLK